jgi:biotin operon repressor
MEKGCAKVRTSARALRLASLLGDNPGQSFSYDELRALLGCSSREAFYSLAYRLRAAGMNVKVSKNLIKYLEIQK